MAKKSERKGKGSAARNERPEFPSSSTAFSHLAQYQVGIVIVAALILLIIFLYTIQIVISPFLILAVIIFILYPIRSNVVAHRLLWIAVLLFIFWFLYMVSGVLVPLVISFGIAYVFNPLIDRLQKKNIPRWATSLGLILGIIAIITIILVLLIPLVIQQFNDLLQSVSNAVADIGEWLREGELFDRLEGAGVPSENIRNIVNTEIVPTLENFSLLLLQAMFDFFIGLSGMITHLINLVTVPFLAFFLMKDFPAVKQRVKLMVPDEFQPGVVYYYRKIDKMLGRYIRGYIVLASINASLAGLLLWIFGVKYAAVMAIITFFLDFIPYFGLVITMILAGIVGFLSEPPVLLRALLAVMSIGALAILENYVLAPFILGKPIGLHPVVLIMTLLIFGFFFGIPGLIIALPTTAIIILFVKEWDIRRRERLGLPPIDYKSI
jgi:predicted PurR-regulated permease PerM